MNNNRKVLNEFVACRKQYEQVEQEVVRIVNQVIEENHIFVMEVSHRIKTYESLESKVIRKNGKYNSVKEITDIVGVRVICYFSDDVDVIADKLAEKLLVDKVNSIDKRETIQATQFGYLSLHCIGKLKPDGGYATELLDIPFEIQLRTVLQHAWAEIEHDLGYKSAYGIPREIRRVFSQAASLLEIADKQFVEVRDKANDYNANVRRMIEDDQADSVTLDFVSLKSYLQINKEINKFYEKVKNELGMDIEIVNPSSYIRQVEWLGILTIGDLARAFQASLGYIYRQLKGIAEEFELDIISSNMMLKYLCYATLIREKYSREQIYKFLMLSMSDVMKLTQTAEKISTAGYEDIII